MRTKSEGSFVASVRVDIITTANLLEWMRSRGVEPGKTSTLLRLALEFLEDQLEAKGMTRVKTVEEAMKVLNGYQYNTGGRGRGALIDKLKNEHIERDDLYSTDDLAQATGVDPSEVARRVEEKLKERSKNATITKGRSEVPG